MPRSVLFAASLGILAVACAAQSTATIPPTFLTREAPAWSSLFGAWPSMRAQVLNRDYRGQAATLKRIDLRLDGGRDASATHFLGRTWVDVQLTMAETDLSKASRTFRANLTTNARSVFRGSITWPSYTSGPPTKRPHDFALAFPFQSNWSYGGTRDLAIDFRFRGGRLANGAHWTTEMPYYVDGIDQPMRVGGTSTNYGKYGCTNAPNTHTPFCVPVLHTYAKHTGDPRTDDSFAFQWWMSGHPARTPAVLQLSIGGSATGVNIGNPCQNFHMGPAIAFLTMTPADNSQPYFAPPLPIREKYTAGAVGISIWTQAGYQSTARNRLELTRAGVAKILAQPTPPAGTVWLHASAAGAITGTQPGAAELPLLRLTR